MRIGFAALPCALLAFVPILSCGGTSSPPTTTPSTAPPGQGAPGSGGAAKWSDMNREQRMGYMKKVVLPKMKEVFTQFDPKEFENVTCLTCHGESAKDGSFKMPNPNLPKLNPEAGFKKHLDKDPTVTKFMMSKVVPEMATMLGTQPFDAQSRIGFGCFGCHSIDK